MGHPTFRADSRGDTQCLLQVLTLIVLLLVHGMRGEAPDASHEVLGHTLDTLPEKLDVACVDVLLQICWHALLHLANESMAIRIAPHVDENPSGSRRLLPRVRVRGGARGTRGGCRITALAHAPHLSRRAHGHVGVIEATPVPAPHCGRPRVGEVVPAVHPAAVHDDSLQLVQQLLLRAVLRHGLLDALELAAELLLLLHEAHEALLRDR
mmetsp:Transcript_62713/g.176864  ORF Transcript_62713/g.176864 Transcript_62713/m.176864 type:complete len:210 (+) Transcript_62713:455-1084(+)